MTIHDGPCSGDEPVEGCYACGLKAKNIAIAPSAMPSRVRHGKSPAPDPAWERGIQGEYRPDGSFMPLLNPDLSPIRNKQYAENRHAIEDGVKRLKSDPHVFSPERTA